MSVFFYYTTTTLRQYFNGLNNSLTELVVNSNSNATYFKVINFGAGPNASLGCDMPLSASHTAILLFAATVCFKL